MSQATPSTDTVTVQLPWKHQFQFAGFYAAIEKGYYKDVGLDVRLLEGGGTGADPLQVVLAGKANFGVGCSELLLARLKGKPIVVLAAIFQRSPFCLLTQAGSGISTPYDLVGKRVTLQSSDRDAEFVAMFRKVGVPMDKMTVLTNRWNLKDLLDGKVDAISGYITTQPYELRSLGGNPVTLRPSAFGIDFYGDTIFTTEEEENLHPDRVARFRSATLKGWEYAVNHREETIEWILNKYGAERQLTRDALESESQITIEIILPDLVELGHLNATRLKRLAATYRDLGMAPTSDFGSRFVYQPVRSAVSFWKTAGLSVALTALGIIAIASFWNLRLQFQISRQRRDLQREVTQRQKVEEALDVSTEQLEAFLANCPLAAFFKDETGRLLRVNQAFADKHGHSPEWWKGKLSKDYLPRETTQIVEEHDRIVQALGRPMQFQERYVDPSGRHEEWLTWRFPMKTQDGASLMGGMSLEVTEQIRAEEALRKAEEKYRSIFENSAEGLLRIGQDGKIITANAAAARFLGYENPGQLIESPKRFADRMVATTVEKDTYRDRLNSGETIGSMEVQIERLDGSKIWVSSSAKAVFKDDGSLSHYETSMEDISERKTLADELRQSQKMDAIGRLAGGVAHDFNNLITAILGYSQLISNGLPESGILREHLKQIISATERASELTRQLLTFSRRQTPERTPTCLNNVVIEMQNLLRRLIGEHIELRTRLHDDLDFTLIDRSEFSQVVMNLVINARDAMPAGGVVEIETQNITIGVNGIRPGLNVKTGEYVCLIVKDTGSGMSQDTLSHIFEPFFSTKPRDKGTGLGLPIVYGVVSHSGGYIDIETEEGLGTAFNIYLPVVERPLLTTQESKKPQPSPDGKEFVMVVEDEIMLRNLVSELLRRQGYTVCEAENGEDALRVLDGMPDTRVDLLVTDVVMPKMNGRDLAHHFGKRFPNAGVLYMSGYTSEAVLQQGLESTNVAFLQKPFTGSELASKVREVIDGKERGSGI